MEMQRRVLRSGLYLILLVSPLPFGSVQAGWVLALQIGAILLGAGALWVVHREGPAALPPVARKLLVLFGVLLGIGALQLLPLPAWLVGWVAGPTRDMREALEGVLQVGSSPGAGVSLSSPATVEALLRLLACGLLGLTAAVSFTRWRHVVWGMAVLVGSAAFQAVYGSLEMLSGRQQIFLYVKKYDTDVATGTFINSNHFAGYLAVVLPLALALTLVYAQRIPRGRSWREKVLRIGEPETLKFVACATAAGILWGGILLSTSRGGLAAALAGTATLALATARSSRRRWLLILVLLLPALVLSLQQIRTPGEGPLVTETEMESLSGRLPIWGAAARMVPSYLVLGSGFGTFEDAFLMYRPETVHARVDHAHNDWLQLTVEGGLLALLAGLGLAWLALRRQPSVQPDSAPAATLVAGLRAGLAAFALHALLDFPARIPAIAALVACQIGILAAAVSLEGPVRLLGREGARRR
jgi:O-antigen ligase